MSSLILEAFNKDGCWHYYNDKPLGDVRYKKLEGCSSVQEIYAPNLVGYRIDLDMESVGNSLFMQNFDNLPPVTELLEFGLVLIITQDTIVIVNSPAVVDMHNIYEV